MTSVQKFLRQINPALAIQDAPSNNCYYNFVADSGNYVGNYPPGYMVLATAFPFNPNTPPRYMRDMGKTIKAVVGTNPAATPGYFREIQVINPVPVASATASTTFGVGINCSGAQTLPSAGNVGDTGYGTYYIPVIINGTVATSDGSTQAVLPQYSTGLNQM